MNSAAELEPESAYQDAIARTTRTIERRAAGFKKLIIAVVAVGSLSLLGAAILGSWQPLLGLGLLLPLCGGLYWRDGDLVDGWRRDILTLWEQGGLELEIFRQTMLAVPTLPPDTLQGMLASLPQFDLPERRMPPILRTALRETLGLIFAVEQDRWAGWAFGYALGYIVLLVTIFGPTGLAIGAGALRFCAFGPQSGRRTFHCRRWQRRMRQLAEKGLDVDAFIPLAEGLDWGYLSAKQNIAYLIERPKRSRS